jgi:hypothetical protein
VASLTAAHSRPAPCPRPAAYRLRASARTGYAAQGKRRTACAAIAAPTRAVCQAAYRHRSQRLHPPADPCRGGETPPRDPPPLRRVQHRTSPCPPRPAARSRSALAQARQGAATHGTACARMAAAGCLRSLWGKPSPVAVGRSVARLGARARPRRRSHNPKGKQDGVVLSKAGPDAAPPAPASKPGLRPLTPARGRPLDAAEWRDSGATREDAARREAAAGLSKPSTPAPTPESTPSAAPRPRPPPARGFAAPPKPGGGSARATRSRRQNATFSARPRRRARKSRHQTADLIRDFSTADEISVKPPVSGGQSDTTLSYRNRLDRSPP